MTESSSVVSGGRSLPQSKNGLCTTPRNVNGALSASLRLCSSPKS